MSRLVISMLLAALTLSAAEIRIHNEWRVSQMEIRIHNQWRVGAKIWIHDQWCLGQVESCTPAAKPGEPCTPVLRFPTTGDFLRYVMRNAFLDILRVQRPDDVAAQDAVANTAKVRADKLLEAAIQ